MNRRPYVHQHTHRLSTAIAVATVLVSLLVGSTAAADKEFKEPTGAKAKKHLDLGNRHYKLQDFKRAIAEYKAGALVEDLPIFLYNLGQSHRQLGDYANAIWYYKRYLSQGKPSAKRKSWVKEVIRDMNKELQRAARNKPPTGPGPGSTVPTPKAKTPTVSVKKPAPSPKYVPWYADTLGWSVAGAGVIALGVGGGLFINASSLETRADASQVQDERISLRETANSRRSIGTITTIVGGALIVGGLIQLIRNPQPERARSLGATINAPVRRPREWTIAVGERWVGLTGRF